MQSRFRRVVPAVGRVGGSSSGSSTSGGNMCARPFRARQVVQSFWFPARVCSGVAAVSFPARLLTSSRAAGVPAPPSFLSSRARSVVLAPAAACAVASPALRTSVRAVQFQQTSETVGGINKGQRAQAIKWATKSTKDYMKEADNKLEGHHSLVQGRLTGTRERMKAVKESQWREKAEAELAFEKELDRIRDDNQARWKNIRDFFKRHGLAFSLLYIGTYGGTFALLYLGFASGFIKKEAAFEFLMLFLGTYIDRDKFYKRIEAWDTYINVGFAFVINECLEVFRFPLVMLTFYSFRPVLTGINTRVKKSIFRWGAAET